MGTRISSLFVLAVLGPVIVKCQTFQRTIGSPNVDERGECIALGTPGTLFVGGSVADSAMVMRLDSTGTPLWCTTFKPATTYNCLVLSMTALPNGDVVGIGNANVPGAGYYGNGFHFRMNGSNGNMIWCVGWDGPVPVYHGRLLADTTARWLLTGGYYDIGASTFSDVYTAWVDANSGAVTGLSPMLDQFAPVPYIDDAVDAVSANGGFYTTSRISVGGAPPDKFRAFIARYDSSGAHQWTRTLLHTNAQSARMYGCKIIAHDDSLTLLVNGDPNGGSANHRLGLVRMDFAGNIAWAKSYDLSGSTLELDGNLVVVDDGYVLCGKSMLNGDDLFMIKTSLSGDVQWCKTYGGPGAQFFNDIRPHPMVVDPGGIWLVGTSTSGGSADLLLLRTDADGNLACGTGWADVLPVTSALPTFSQLTTVINTPLMVATQPVAGSAASALPPACTVEVSLGPDTITCGSILLVPSTNSNQYQWQDGSNAPTFTTTTPGIYWVEVTEGCCSARDTVLVSMGFPPIAAFVWEQDTLDQTSVWFINTSQNNTSVEWWIEGDTLTGDTLYHDFGEYGHYLICIVAANGCGSDTICMSVDIFSMETVDDQTLARKFRAFCSDGVLYCQWPEAGQYVVRIFDALGRDIGTLPSITPNTFAVPALATGAYTIVAQGAAGEPLYAHLVVP